MPANSDHIRRDAEHAARMEISILVSKFIRRMQEDAKAHISEAISSAGSRGEGVIDGTQIGRKAAETAISNYLGDSEPRKVVQAESRPALNN